MLQLGNPSSSIERNPSGTCTFFEFERSRRMAFDVAPRTVQWPSVRRNFGFSWKIDDNLRISSWSKEHWNKIQIHKAVGMTRAQQQEKREKESITHGQLTIGRRAIGVKARIRWTKDRTPEVVTSSIEFYTQIAVGVAFCFSSSFLRPCRSTGCV